MANARTENADDHKPSDLWLRGSVACICLVTLSLDASPMDAASANAASGLTRDLYQPGLHGISAEKHAVVPHHPPSVATVL